MNNVILRESHDAIKQINVVEPQQNGLNRTFVLQPYNGDEKPLSFQFDSLNTREILAFTIKMEKLLADVICIDFCLISFFH